ncbi:TRM11 family methyltransferase [Gracilinema caldarium]|uniref:TRM11 family SAM-dependent methyltransferase n=1 Tax=Gracilinema caldarium TaxID=215591 RepID=UPI0026EDB95C|nr:methyltransferase [Gracilinema caldarium]
MDYLGTFPAGFTELVKRLLLRDLERATILFSDESVIAFRTQTVPVKLPYLKNQYILIAWEKTENLASAYQIILDRKNLGTFEALSDRLAKKRFVIRTFIEGKPAPVIPHLHRQVEKEMVNRLSGKPNSERPELEFHLHVRKNKQCFFVLQEKDHREEPLPAGTLPPYLCRLLIELSDPQRDDIFLDPFMGSGAIPFARAQVGPYGLIFAGDKDAEKVASFKAQLKNKRWEKRRKTIFPKLLDAAKLDIFQDAFITRIVSDPPWGLYENLNAASLYELFEKFLDEAARVLAKTGKMVLLLGSHIPLPAIIEKTSIPFRITEYYPVLVSGQKALVYILVPI